MEDEVFEIYDRQGKMIGQDIRANAHAQGLWHAVVHVWVYDETWIYFQQRSLQKRDYPGKYDISTAGHVDVKESSSHAAIRECQEEIGLVMKEKQLQYLGDVKEAVLLPCFKDKEIAHVYLYKDTQPNFHLGEEVEQVFKAKRCDVLTYAFHRQGGLILYTLDERQQFHVQDSDVCNHASIYYQWLLEKMR